MLRATNGRQTQNDTGDNNSHQILFHYSHDSFLQRVLKNCRLGIRLERKNLFS
jgi:hypothetical protein